MSLKTVSLKDRVKSELPRLIGFCLVGGGGFIVHSSLVFLLTGPLAMGPILSWFPAFIMAVTFTWLLNRFLTFRGLGGHSTSGEAARYFIVESFGAGINFTVYAGIIFAKVPVLSYPILALACGAGVAFLFNYIVLRLVVYNKPGEAALQKPLGADIDEIYYQHAMSVPFARRVTIYARQRMYRHFIAVMTPDENTRILDFGISETENEESNILEKSYPHPQNICCVGIGDGEEVIKAFPNISYVPITPGEPLPFADKSFDVAYSNAVFEHMGSRTARLKILQELSRVAKHVYITIPNRWFPLEHHTAIPLLHFIPKLFRVFTRKGKYEYWSVPQNLQFLSLSDLEQVFTRAGLKGVGARTGLPLGPFSSNLAYWTKSEAGKQNDR